MDDLWFRSEFQLKCQKYSFVEMQFFSLINLTPEKMYTSSCSEFSNGFISWKLKYCTYFMWNSCINYECTLYNSSKNKLFRYCNSMTQVSCHDNGLKFLLNLRVKYDLFLFGTYTSDKKYALHLVIPYRVEWPFYIPPNSANPCLIIFFSCFSLGFYTQLWN